MVRQELGQFMNEVSRRSFSGPMNSSRATPYLESAYEEFYRSQRSEVDELLKNAKVKFVMDRLPIGDSQYLNGSTYSYALGRSATRLEDLAAGIEGEIRQERRLAEQQIIRQIEAAEAPKLALWEQDREEIAARKAKDRVGVVQARNWDAETQRHKRNANLTSQDRLTDRQRVLVKYPNINPKGMRAALKRLRDGKPL